MDRINRIFQESPNYEKELYFDTRKRFYRVWRWESLLRNKNGLDSRPVFHFQTGDTGKFTRVVGHQGGPQAQGVRGDQRVQRADRFAFFLQGRAQCTAEVGGLLIEGGDGEIQQKFLQ